MEPDEYEAADAALIRELADRKPSPYPRLLMWAPPDGQNARIEPSLITPDGMISDYFEFARSHPMPATPLEQELDRQVLPLLFVYRHATELALKYALLQLAYHLRQREPGFTYPVPEDHRLGQLLDKVRVLYEKAKPYLNELGTVEFLSAQAQSFIRELDQLDPKGEAFRYAHQKRNKKTGISDPQIHNTVPVSIDALRAGMLHVEKELLWLIQLTEITSGLYDEWTADMLADMGW